MTREVIEDLLVVAQGTMPAVRAWWKPGTEYLSPTSYVTKSCAIILTKPCQLYKSTLGCKPFSFEREKNPHIVANNMLYLFYLATSCYQLRGLVSKWCTTSESWSINGRCMHCPVGKTLTEGSGIAYSSRARSWPDNKLMLFWLMHVTSREQEGHVRFS